MQQAGHGCKLIFTLGPLYSLPHILLAFIKIYNYVEVIRNNEFVKYSHMQTIAFMICGSKSKFMQLPSHAL